MIALVQALQALSGTLWLVLALYKLPRMAGAWKAGVNRDIAISARNGFLAWLMVGFCVRWLVWRNALHVMRTAELICWAALYALSGLCAVWFFTNALQGRIR